MHVAQKVVHILAIVTHPVFIILWLAFVLFSSSYYLNELLPSSFVWRLSMPILASIVLVLTLSWLAKQAKIFSEVGEKASRQLLLGIYMITFFILLLNLHRASLPPFYTEFILLGLLYATGGWLVLLKWNYSLHVQGWSGMFFTFIFYQWFYRIDLMPWIIFSAIVTGFVASLRLFQHAHSFQECLRSLLISLSVFILSFCCKWGNFWL